MENKEFWLKKEGKSGEFDYIDQDGVSSNSPFEWLFTGILGGCGCGGADELGERAYKILDLFATPHMERTWSVYNNDVDEVLAHWLDSKGLTEHGGSISGSWLTEKGTQIHTSIKGLLPTTLTDIRE